MANVSDRMIAIPGTEVFIVYLCPKCKKYMFLYKGPIMMHIDMVNSPVSIPMAYEWIVEVEDYGPEGMSVTNVQLVQHVCVEGSGDASKL